MKDCRMLNPSNQVKQVVTISGFRNARLPKVYDNVKVAMGTEETIYDQEYVSVVVNNSRVVRVLKSSLEFIDD